jgi:outer membrane cobalamin receptor
MSRKIYGTLVILVGMMSLFISVPHIWAAQQEESIFMMEEIVVIASKYPELVLDSIASVEVISREEIETSQSNNLAGIIANIGGLEIVDYGAPGDIKSISIRGSSPEQVLILIDGQVANDPQIGKIDLGLIPADIIEKIEIYRGPASALYGSNALGGVINIITRQGEEDRLVTSGIDIGSYKTQKYAVSYQSKDEDISTYLTSQYYQTNGDRENSQLNKIFFMGKLSNELDEQTDLNLSLRFHNYNRGLPGSTDYPSPEAIQEDRNIDLNLNWQKREEDRDLNAVAWFSSHRIFFDNPGMFGHTGPSIHKTYSTGFSFDSTHYNFSFNDKDDSDSGHTLTWGGEVINNTIDSTDIGNHQAINSAVFIQDSWQAAEDNDLKLTAGLRYDYNQLFGGQFNPRMGVNYRLEDEVSFHASVSRAYRAPTFDDLYWPEDAYTGGNPDLVPETAWAYEAGIRYLNQAGDMHAELNLFRKNSGQLINWAPDDAGIWRPSNIGSARVDGVEVLLKKKLDEHILGNVSYTYLDARDIDTDTQLKPKHKIGVGLNYSDKVGDNDDNLTIGLDGYIVTGRPDDLEPYTFFNANLSQDLTIDEEDDQKITIQFSIKNLLNQQPELVSGYPVQGRTFLVGISTEF